MMRTTCLVVGLFFATSFLAMTAWSQGGENEPATRCVNLARIDRTQILNDQNIVFHMKGGETYLNRLVRRCPGLQRNRPFMFRTSTGRVCDVDVLTVLDNWGFGFTPGISCGLGAFESIDESQIDQIASRNAAPVDAEPVELEQE